MFHREALEKFRGRTSGRRALEYIYRFWPHDRLSTFPGYHRAAVETARIMREIGLEQVELLQYPTDGKLLFADWESPQGWDATSGVLEVVLPEGGRRRIADRQADPCHLFLWCGNTPPQGVKTTIVRLDSGRQIRGKLVFHDREKLDEALRGRLIAEGALGVVSDELPYWPEARVREENLHLVRWQNAFLIPGNPENLLGIQITPAEGDCLRAALDQQAEVEAFARIETRLYADTLPVTTGVVRGSDEPEKEIWLIQHLHEPGAHDNASGVACALELARTIRELAAAGEIEPPRRTIRVICSWEILGFMAHLTARPESAKNVICALNPDMIGADQDRCRSWLQIFHNPECNPSFIDELTRDLVRQLYRHYPRWHWESKPFMINDNFLADPSIGIPCPSLIFLRDRYYHTSSDRPENLDPVVMQEMSALMAAAVYTAANGGARAALELGALMLKEAAAGLAALAVDRTDSRAYEERAGYLREVNGRALDTLAGLPADAAGKREVAGKIAGWKERLDRYAAAGRPEGEGFSRAPQSEQEREADRLVPTRRMIGSLYLTRVPLEEKQRKGLADFSGWSYAQNAPLYWADGRRSIYEIQWYVGQELGQTPELGYLLELFRTLEAYGYVTLGAR